MKSIFIGHEHDLKRVYSEEARKILSESAGCEQSFFNKESLMNADLTGVNYIFSTWDMVAFTEEEIKVKFPSLKAIFFAAGSVKKFAEPFLKQGVKVFSAWAANAIPVAEFSASQIILANKGFFLTSVLYKKQLRAEAVSLRDKMNGNYGANVGILGAGMIGSKTIEILHSLTNVNIFVFDPFLSDERAKILGVKKAGLKEIFSACDVISNHLANNEQTQNIINYELLSLLKDNAVFINTGRGAQVDEDTLAVVMKNKPYATAVLDVTKDEPLKENHAFYNLDNVILTPHIAGSNGKEVWRMADYMIEEFNLYSSGKQTRFEVTLEMLKTMA